MKQNFCDRTILFTKKFVMSSVKRETGTQSFPLSDGGNREAKKDSLIHEARHLIAVFFFSNLSLRYSLVCGTCFFLRCWKLLPVEMN